MIKVVHKFLGNALCCCLVDFGLKETLKQGVN
jgi:hypothetical protein